MLNPLAVGQAVSYYLCGWRYGVVKHICDRGKRKGMIQIENPVSGLVWVPVLDVNEAGDTTYHGPNKRKNG